jgi:argininosuccinate lyase
MAKLWGGRFKKKMDPDFEAFSASLKTDVRLLPYDLRVNLAHVKALRKCGVLTRAEAKKLSSTITSITKDRLDPKQEDVHSAVDALLKKRLGELADKLHTGRSRNDLVSQSSRLYVLDHTRKITAQIGDLQKAIVAKAAEYQDMLVPGMTHLQNAQVVSQAHILLSYAEMLGRARSLFRGTLDLHGVCVLGSGALAGTTFGLDQKLYAREFKLSRVTNNSYDVSGDRGFVLDFLHGALTAGIALSRIAEDLMIGQTKGHSLVDVDQAFCTGSSMMPQKKNADFLELLRGLVSSFTADYTGVATLLKGLPTSYNRDLQWDKPFLFDAAEKLEAVLPITTKLFKSLKFDRARAQALLMDETLYATDLADYLVKKGTAFKKAHEQAGRLVSFAEENGVQLSKIGLDIYKKFAPGAQGDVYALFDPKHSVRLKKTQGSTNPVRVKAEIARWKRELR